MFGTNQKPGKRPAGDLLAESLAGLCSNNLAVEAVINALRLAVTETGASGGYYLLLDELWDDLLTTQACYSPAGEIPFPSRLETAGTFSGQAIQTERTVIVKCTTAPELFEREFGSGVKQAMVIPMPAIGMRAEGPGSRNCQGVVSFVSLKNPDAFQGAIVQRAEAFVAAMSLAVANDRLEQFRKKTIVESLQRISAYIEAKDPRTAGHSLRVARLTLGLGQKLNVDVQCLQDLQIAATLMDIGSIAIPDHITHKPEGLTAEEFEIVKTHPSVSHEICEKLQLSERIRMLVRNHHERLDGSGYPDHIRSNELSLPLRIITVADAFDAMRCDRAHRKGMRVSEALTQLTAEAGTKFDPMVVQALRDLIEAREFDDIFFAEAA
ncbi:MAG: HD-GYP domain-containing protein [Armatimonadota bacterium]